MNKTKADYTKHDIKRMTKRFIVFTVAMPVVYPLALLEKFFTNSKESFSIFTLKFADDWYQTLKLLLGGTEKDNSIKIADIEFNQKVRKSKIDKRVVKLMLEVIGSRYFIYFGKKEISYFWSSESGESRIKIREHSENQFELVYQKYLNWGSKYFHNKNSYMTFEELEFLLKDLEK